MVIKCISNCSAAVSGCAAAGARYAANKNWLSPTRRTVTSRSPSCVGSTVQSFGRMRVGFAIVPKFAAITASVFSLSNLPAMRITALSGW